MTKDTDPEIRSVLEAKGADVGDLVMLWADGEVRVVKKLSREDARDVTPFLYALSPVRAGLSPAPDALQDYPARRLRVVP